MKRTKTERVEMMKKRIKVLFVLVFCLSFLPAAYADTPMPKPAIKETKETQAPNTAPAAMNRKLGRGLANVAFGWMEIFKGISEVNAKENWVAALTWGPVYGGANALSRTATGLYETATFPFPGPEHYEPIIQPEFVLDKTQSEERVHTDPVYK